jgi:hypothetical protein
MLEFKERNISQEEFTALINKMGDGGELAFKKRHSECKQWIEDFISATSAYGIYPTNTRLINGYDIDKASFTLTFLYFSMVEQFVRLHLISGDVINHYKIASTTEFIIMKFPPFELSNGTVNDEMLKLNADFAFFVAIQIIIDWNINKTDFSISLVKNLIETDENTREFIAEHKAWLQNNLPITYQSVIFSNMQTMRLLHYWLREPKDAAFKAYVE